MARHLSTSTRTSGGSCDDTDELLSQDECLRHKVCKREAELEEIKVFDYRHLDGFTSINRLLLSRTCEGTRTLKPLQIYEARLHAEELREWLARVKPKPGDDIKSALRTRRYVSIVTEGVAFVAELHEPSIGQIVEIRIDQSDKAKLADSGLALKLHVDKCRKFLKKLERLEDAVMEGRRKLSGTYQYVRSDDRSTKMFTEFCDKLYVFMDQLLKSLTVSLTD